jgi:hypothetical protein
MSKQELLSRIETERALLETVVGALRPEQMTQSATLGEWSVKDTLAHITMLTARCVTLLYQVEQGQTPDDMEFVDLSFSPSKWDVDAANAVDYAAQKDRPLELVQGDFRGAHRQLLKRLSGWSEADLTDNRRFGWLRGASMADFLLSETAEHEAEHRQQIEAWQSGRGSLGGLAAT